jgi:hypothetical protein
LEGPYPLTLDSLESFVGRSPGAYIILGTNNKGVYVGRSDDDLRGKMKQHAPNPILRFFFEHTRTAMDAYNLECLWYHQYEPQEKVIHPGKSHSVWSCLACGQ